MVFLHALQHAFIQPFRFHKRIQDTIAVPALQDLFPVPLPLLLCTDCFQLLDVFQVMLRTLKDIVLQFFFVSLFIRLCFIYGNQLPAVLRGQTRISAVQFFALLQDPDRLVQFTLQHIPPDIVFVVASIPGQRNWNHEIILIISNGIQNHHIFLVIQLILHIIFDFN